MAQQTLNSIFLVENLLDAGRDFRVEFVENVNGVVDLLACMKRWPERRDGKESMKSDLLISGRLHPLESIEFSLKLVIEADNRLVIAFLTDLVTENINFAEDF